MKLSESGHIFQRQADNGTIKAADNSVFCMAISIIYGRSFSIPAEIPHSDIKQTP